MLRVKLGELSPDTVRHAAPGRENRSGETGKYGMTLAPLTPDLSARLGLPRDAQGLAVTAVDPFSPAADAGLQTGDVISQVNRQPVHTLAELQAALDQADKRPALLLVNRRGNSFFLTFRPRG